MHRNVETRIGRLVTDPELRRRFLERRSAMRTTNRFASIARLPFAALTLAPFPGLASAQASHGDEWRWSLTPYAWATDVDVNAELGGRQVVNDVIPVEDLLEDVDWTVQGRLEVQKGAFGLLLDVFFVSMSDEVDGLSLPQGAGTGNLDWTLDMTVADIAGTYDPEGDARGVSFLYGLRLIDQRAEVEAEFTTSGGTAQEHYEASETLIDALVGLRFRDELTSNLSIEAQLDASTGDTEHTWSVFPSLRYSFGNCGLVAGYRYLSIDFAEENDLDSELGLSGPLVGLSVSL
jgi:hypothetical protein